MLIDDGQEPNTVRHTKYKLLELAAHVDLFDPESVEHYVATAVSEKPSSRSQPRQKTSFATPAPDTIIHQKPMPLLKKTTFQECNNS